MGLNINIYPYVVNSVGILRVSQAYVYHTILYSDNNVTCIDDVLHTYVLRIYYGTMYGLLTGRANPTADSHLMEK